MFEHSVKVPRHYKIAANIFKKVATEGGSVKTLLYDDKLRHFRTNVLFALITETVKHAADIDKIFESSEILKKESRLDPWLAKVLTAELLFGKKSLPGKSKPEQTILAYKEQFETYANEHKDELKTEVSHRPRYVRINTNLLTTSDAIRAFQDEGYKFIRCTSGSYNDYLQQIQGLTEYDFTQDYHIKTIFVFPHGTKLHEHELYLENQIILQDKATAMAVHLLAPPTGSVVLDMCAAPGMKTTQVAAYMRNEGKIYAVERNEKRFQTLTNFVTKTGCKCVELIHRDALEIKRGDYDDVEYILLDPSCSGSGMEFSVHNYIEDTRLAKLTSLQEKFLKHAMNAFPKAKRIVYSTCSLFPEENERVITNVVKNSRAKWRVQDVKELLKGQWNNFGSGMYGSMGTRCLYAKPETDLTTGFFLAVLDRDQADLEKAVNADDRTVNGETNSTTKKSNKRKKHGKKDNDTKTEDDEEDESEHLNESKNKTNLGLESNDHTNTIRNENTSDISNKKTKSKHEEARITGLDSFNDIVPQQKKKKNKRKYYNEEESNLNDDTDRQTNNEDVTATEECSQTKKKKKHKTKPTSTESINGNGDIDVKINKDITTLNDISQTEKRKNKKHKIKDTIKDDTGLQLNNEDNTFLEDTSQTVKRKNKKHKIKDIIKDDTGLQLNNEDNTLLEDTSQTGKRKKKKHKNKDNTDSELINETRNEDEHNNDTVESRKKKKKNRKDTEPLEEEVPDKSTEISDQLNIDPTTKKKKKKCEIQ